MGLLPPELLQSMKKEGTSSKDSGDKPSSKTEGGFFKTFQTSFNILTLGDGN